MRSRKVDRDGEANCLSCTPSCPIRVPHPSRSPDKSRFPMVPNPRPPLRVRFLSIEVKGLAAWKLMSIAVKHVPICTHTWRVLTSRSERNLTTSSGSPVVIQLRWAETRRVGFARAHSLRTRTQISVTAVTLEPSAFHSGIFIRG